MQWLGCGKDSQNKHFLFFCELFSQPIMGSNSKKNGSSMIRCAKNLDLTFACSPKFKDKFIKEVKILITEKGLGVGIFRVCGWM